MLQGTIILAGVFGLYAWAHRAGMEDSAARALAFVALIVSNFVLAFADSAEPGTRFFDRRRKVFWMIGTAAMAVVCLILYQPGVAAMFQLSVPDPGAFVAALVVAVLGAGWFGFLKRAGILRVTA